MGVFMNTHYSATIQSLVQATEEKLANPYYKFSDKKPVEVDYFKQNKEKSTLDETTANNYQFVGEDSPLRYNLIKSFFLYGFEKITLDYDLTDYGLESADITGEVIVLPNTIEPLPGDFFKVKSIKQDVLFKVNRVTPDTLDNGNNIYKIEYKLELVGQYDQIMKQVVKSYQFVIDNVGTDFSCFITEESFSIASDLAKIQQELINAYQIFFDPRLQTFVFTYKGAKMYDPYLIEFLIRNKVLANADEYFHVAHATAMNHLFPYYYSKSLFAMIEDPTTFDLDRAVKKVTAKKILDPNSLFVTRLDDYYKIDYFDDKAEYITRFNHLDPRIAMSIAANEKFGEDALLYPFNMWISYFTGEIIDDSELYTIKNLDFYDCPEHFYLLPVCIFIIQKYALSLLQDTSDILF